MSTNSSSTVPLPLFWCHECAAEVSVLGSNEGEFSCTQCNSVFCELIDVQNDPIDFVRASSSNAIMSTTTPSAAAPSGFPAANGFSFSFEMPSAASSVAVNPMGNFNAAVPPPAPQLDPYDI